MSSMPQTSSSPAVSAPLTLALSKGRIFEETLPLLAAAGIEVAEDPETSRKLILPTTDANVRVIIVRATDVPTYVEYGAADFGVAGKDVLLEHGGSGPSTRIDARMVFTISYGATRLSTFDASSDTRPSPLSMRTPIWPSSFSIVRTSCKSGTFSRCTGSALSRLAHRIGNAAFFAPETTTSPDSG